MNIDNRVFWSALLMAIMMGALFANTVDVHSEYIPIDVRIMQQTEKHVLIENDDGKWWVPWEFVAENKNDFYDGYEGEMHVIGWFFSRSKK